MAMARSVRSLRFAVEKKDGAASSRAALALLLLTKARMISFDYSTQRFCFPSRRTSMRRNAA
jgi:hypothetical protein